MSLKMECSWEEASSGGNILAIERAETLVNRHNSYIKLLGSHVSLYQYTHNLSIVKFLFDQINLM